MQYYTKIAKDLQEGIDNVLWNEEEQIWLDYDTRKQRSRNRYYATNLAPLYTGSYDKSKAEQLANSSVAHLKKHGIPEYSGKWFIQRNSRQILLPLFSTQEGKKIFFFSFVDFEKCLGDVEKNSLFMKISSSYQFFPQN